MTAETDTPRRPRGRPREATARRKMVHVRCSEDERADLAARAKARGIPVQQLARELLWPTPPR